MPESKGVSFGKKKASLPLPQGRKFILGIGINNYTGTGWRPLHNAVRDVEQIVQLLCERYDFDEARLLRNAEATRDSIEEALYRYTDPEVLGEHDSLLIYYSGHGHLDRNQKGYWVPVNAEMNKISTYLPNSRIREIISDIQCRHVLLISDSCFSGTFFTRGGPQASQAATEYERRPSRYAFCSGRHDEEVSDGAAGGNSPFARAIVQELRLNDAAKLNIVRLADKVIEITRANYPQMPEANPIQGAGHAGGQFVFTLRDASAPVPQIGVTEPEQSDVPTDGQTRSPEPLVVIEPEEPATPLAARLNAEQLAAMRKELQTLVARGQSDKALQQLEAVVEDYYPDLKDEVYSLEARWEQLKRQERMGFLSFSEASLERNKITGAILGIISGSLV